MEQIVIHRRKNERKAKRTSVVVTPQTYIKIYELAQETGLTVEAIVDRLLMEALQYVKIED